MRRSERAKRLSVRRAGDAAFREDGRDVPGGGNVESGMGGGNIRRDANALKMRDFIGGTLFDGNVLAIRYGQIESGNGRGNIKRHIIFFGEDGDLVRADFVDRKSVV